MSTIIPPRFHIKTDMSPRADKFLKDLKYYAHKNHYKIVVKFNGPSTKNYKRNDAYCLKKYATERRIYFNERDPFPELKRLKREQRELQYEEIRLVAQVSERIDRLIDIEERIKSLTTK